MLRCFFLVLACAAPATAQPEPDLVTDRPDFTESGVVVPLGRVQIEAGLTAAVKDGAERLSGPELLVRWTPLPRFELRFGAPNYVDTEDDLGFDNPSLGGKMQFGPFGAWDLAALATVSTFSDGSIDPELIVVTSYAHSERSAYGGQFVLGRNGVADVWTFGGTLVHSMSLSEDAFLFFDARWGVFVELAVTVPEHGAAEVLQHAGFTYAVSPNLQLDAHAGIGLTSAAPDGLLGVGLTVRR